jgi:hypothetical protein
MKAHLSFVIVCAGTILALGTIAVPAHATTLMRMSLAQMARAAHEIVRARCLANRTAWDQGEIWTFTKFEIEETWRGTVRGQIIVRMLGGRTEQLTSFVSGVPRFRPSEEVVLFLEPTSRGDFSVVSWEQGTFRIQRDASSGGERVTQDTASLETFDPKTRRFEVSGIRNMPIADFRAQVDAAAANAPGSMP